MSKKLKMLKNIAVIEAILFSLILVYLLYPRQSYRQAINEIKASEDLSYIWKNSTQSTLPEQVILPVIEDVKNEDEVIETPEQIIERVAKENGAVNLIPTIKRVAWCESRYNINAKNVNANGTVDYGLMQINTFYHPEVSVEQALDPEFSIKFFIKKYNQGSAHLWRCY